MKEFTTSNGRHIRIYDDLFDHSERVRLHQEAKKFSYTFASDTNYMEDGPELNFAHPLTDEEVDYLGILKNPKLLEVLKPHSPMRLLNARINLSTLSDTNKFHTDDPHVYASSAHKQIITVLYYLNMRWELEWGGHTLFANDACDELEFCCVNKPGRVAVFDGGIPHSIGAPTREAKTIRMTLALQFGKE